MQRLQMQNVLYPALRGTRAKTEFFLAWHVGNTSQTLRGFLNMKM